MYSGITLNDVPLDIFMKYFNEKTYGDIVNTPVYMHLKTKMNMYSKVKYASSDYSYIPYDLSDYLIRLTTSKHPSDYYVAANYIKLLGLVSAESFWDIDSNTTFWDLDLETTEGLEAAQSFFNDILTDDGGAGTKPNSSWSNIPEDQGQHLLGYFKHDDTEREVYTMPVPLTPKMALTGIIKKSTNGLYNGFDIIKATSSDTTSLTLNTQQVKTYLDRVCYKVEMNSSNDDVYINGGCYSSAYTWRLETLKNNIATLENIIDSLSSPDPTVCDLNNTNRQKLLPSIRLFDGYETKVVYIPKTTEMSNFVPEGSIVRDNILDTTITNTYGGSFYFIINCNKVEVPEYTESGENVYIDSYGMKTTKASYSNSFLTHQNAVRAAFNKVVANDNWMYHLPEGELSLIQVGNKTQLRAYSRYCVATQYKLVNEVPEGFIPEETILPYKLVNNLTMNYTTTSVDTYKNEMQYDYLEDLPEYKCYIDYNEVPTIGSRLYSDQLEQEGKSIKGKNVRLKFYTRTINSSYSGTGQSIPVSKYDTITMRITINSTPISGSVQMNGEYITTSVFDLYTKQPYILIGVTADKDTLVSYINQYLSINYNNTWYSGKIIGNKLQVSSAQVDIPSISKQPLDFYLGSELGFSEEDVNYYFGKDISEVFFLKIPLYNLNEHLAYTYIGYMSGDQGGANG